VSDEHRRMNDLDGCFIVGWAAVILVLVVGLSFEVHETNGRLKRIEKQLGTLPASEASK